MALTPRGLLYLFLGLWAGLAVLLIGLEVTFWGWESLDVSLLIMSWMSCAPLAGLIGRGIRYRRLRGLSSLRVEIRDLIIAVAILALVLGGGIEAGRLSRAARSFRLKAISSASMEQGCRAAARQLEAEAARCANEAALLRDGKIPESLTQHQKEFLRSLDQGVSPDYRQKRYEIIADSAEEMHRYKNASARQTVRMVDYFAVLRAKYERAVRRPWIPVPPDPPRPF
jgi:hypothetical protein